MTRTLTVTLLVVATLLMAGCGSSPQGYLGRTFDDRGGNRYFSNNSVSSTVGMIVANDSPDARESDGSSSYLRYGDDVVTVSPAGGGSDIRVDDVDSGRFNHLGSGFNAGSPASSSDDGGPGDVK